MGGRWGRASLAIAVAWLSAFAVIAAWEFRAAETFSLRGGQAGLPYPWTAAVVLFGGPLALLASVGCSVAAVLGRGFAGRVWPVVLGPAVVVVGGLAVYLLLGLAAPSSRG
jgi:hypothetical protein